MIRDRPTHLLNQEDYKKLPAKPFHVNFGIIPELVRKSVGPVSGIQPATGAMVKAAGGALHDMPSEGEIELFRKAETRFQAIVVVMNIAHLKVDGEVSTAFPYALTLLPGSKRDAIDVRTIDAIAKLDVQKFLKETQPCYTNFNPFAGSWSMFAPLSSLLGGEKPYTGFIDELGIVVGQYFLATHYTPADVIEAPLGLKDPRSEEKYRKHRSRLLYSLFGNVGTRRLWGAQSPIELFLLQELLRRGLSPTLQMLMFEDGAIFASLYDLWRDVEFRYSPGLITEPDFYFSEKKIAVFCDSAKYHRSGKAKAKDVAVDERLKAIGVSSVRVPGKLIVANLSAAADLVSNALAS